MTSYTITGPTLTLTPEVEEHNAEYYAGLCDITGPTLTLTPSVKVIKITPSVKNASLTLTAEISPVEIYYRYSINNLS